MRPVNVMRSFSIKCELIQICVLDMHSLENVEKVSLQERYKLLIVHKKKINKRVLSNDTSIASGLRL